LELVALGAGVFYAIVTYLMWVDSNKNFAVDERAWVGPVAVNADVKPMSHPKMTILIKNTGKTPAFSLTAKQLIWLDTTGKFKPVWRGTTPPVECNLAGVLFPGGTLELQLEFPMNIPDENFESAFKTGITSVYAYSLISYRDAFGKSHTTELCFQHDSSIKADTNVSCSEGYNNAN
jgi:hypothetical protein